jgi:hypothetical protein
VTWCSGQSRHVRKRNLPVGRSCVDDSACPRNLDLSSVRKFSATQLLDLVERYADLGLGLVDASIVAIAERLGADTIATLNRRDFTVVRLVTWRPSSSSPELSTATFPFSCLSRSRSRRETATAPSAPARLSR